MLLVVLFTGLGSILWTAIVRPKPGDVLLEMGHVFFPTVVACWAVLVPSVSAMMSDSGTPEPIR